MTLTRPWVQAAVEIRLVDWFNLVYPPLAQIRYKFMQKRGTTIKPLADIRPLQKLLWRDYTRSTNVGFSVEQYMRGPLPSAIPFFPLHQLQSIRSTGSGNANAGSFDCFIHEGNGLALWLHPFAINESTFHRTDPKRHATLVPRTQPPTLALGDYSLLNIEAMSTHEESLIDWGK